MFRNFFSNIFKKQADKTSLVGRKVDIGNYGSGVFQAWGIDYEEKCQTCYGSYSTAIVLMDDGTVVNVALSLLRFVEN